MSYFHLGLFGQVSAFNCTSDTSDLFSSKIADSVGIGRGRVKVAARDFVSSKNLGGSLIKADWRRLADSMLLWVEALGMPNGRPVGPILAGLGLRREGFLANGSGAWTSPRLTARLSCSSALCCLPEIGFRRGMLAQVDLKQSRLEARGLRCSDSELIWVIIYTLFGISLEDIA
jgi:hypothetical protein